MRRLTTRCAVMLCVGRPKGLVRAQVYLTPGDATLSIREIPMCGSCAAVLELVERLHLTPGGAVYVDDFDRLLPRRRA